MIRLAFSVENFGVITVSLDEPTVAGQRPRNGTVRFGRGTGFRTTTVTDLAFRDPVSGTLFDVMPVRDGHQKTSYTLRQYKPVEVATCG